MRNAFVLILLSLCCACAVAPAEHAETQSSSTLNAQLRDLDFKARDFASNAGLSSIREGEVRVWTSSANSLNGLALVDSEVVKLSFSFRTSDRRSSEVEIHKNAVWVRSVPPPGVTQQIRDAATKVLDLHGKNLSCADVLDGETYLVEAMVSGTRALLQAHEPDEHTNDDCRRIWELATLMRSARSEEHTSELQSREN